MRRFTLCAITLMLFAFGQIVTAEQLDTNGPFKRPARMAGRLSYLGKKEITDGLSKPQWTEVLLTWLIDERNHPTPTYTGMGGGDIDTLYTQAQIWTGLYAQGDPATLIALVDSPRLKNEDVRNGLRLALGIMGDVRQIPAIEQILAHDPNPQYRKLATRALSKLNVQDAVGILEAAANDPYFVTDGAGPTETKYYPVRVMAQEALRKLKRFGDSRQANPQRLETLARQTSDFADLVRHMSIPSAQQNTVTNRLVALINSDKTASAAQPKPAAK